MPTTLEFDRTATQQRTGLTATARDDRQLIRCATLAASSHNTQPWTFEISPDAITIGPDLTRRCSVVDPDDAHLFKSLGCAAENLVQAAGAQGLAADVRFDASRDAVVVGLEPSASASSSELFQAIGARQCTRSAFDGTPVDPDDVAKLESAGTGPGVRTVMITDRVTQVERDTAHIESSAGIAVVVTERCDKPAWVAAGRAYERFALQATVLDIRTAFVNQPIEVPSLRGGIEALLGLEGEHVQLAVRFGHGGLAPYSLRRQIDEVIDT